MPLTEPICVLLKAANCFGTTWYQRSISMLTLSQWTYLTKYCRLTDRRAQLTFICPIRGNTLEDPLRVHWGEGDPAFTVLCTSTKLILRHAVQNLQGQFYPFYFESVHMTWTWEGPTHWINNACSTACNIKHHMLNTIQVFRHKECSETSH